MRNLTLPILLFLIVVQIHTCPNGYIQAPNDGACFQINVYFDNFIGQYQPQSFDEANGKCGYSGAYLASVHSKEENDYVYSLTSLPPPPLTPSCSSHGANIGLKCKGLECSWFDRSPVTYTNFKEGHAPIDDDEIRCYGISSNSDHKWSKKDCQQPSTKTPADCWVCKKPIDCFLYETFYHGGCVSVYTWPLDLENAEASCPTGGHLVSIHNDDENIFYKQLALDTGVNGTIFIGGQISKGQFQWLDGTDYDDSTQWAKGFPNELLGSCAQMMLDSNFGVQGLWSNVDCTVKQPYICFRNGNSPALLPLPTPKADEYCPPIQYFTGSGSVYSPNYPVSIPTHQTCEYVLEVEEGLKASIIFHKFDCQQGSLLALYDGKEDEPFITFTSNYPYPTQAYTANSNVIKMIFTVTGSDEPVGTGWEAEFTGH